MEVIDAIHSRRSIRRFVQTPVPLAVLEKVLDAARWAPSSCNRQITKFIAVSGSDVKERLVSSAGTTRLILRAPVALFVVYDSNINKQYRANLQSASASIQNLLLAAHAVGLGSVWVAEIGDEKKAKEVLSIPADHSIAAMVLLGYPDEKPHPPARRGVGEILSSEKYNFGKGESGGRWTRDKLVDFASKSIRATSPEVGYEPFFKNEFEKKVAVIESLLPQHSRKAVYLYNTTGNTLFAIAGRIAGQLTSCDFSAEISNWIIARQSALGLKKRIGHAIEAQSSLPLADSSSDLVLCINKLEFIPGPDGLISEISRVSSPGASLILSFTNVSSAYGIFIAKIKRSSSITQFGQINPASLPEVRSLLHKAGWRIDSEIGVGLLPSGDSFSRMQSLKSLVGFARLLGAAGEFLESFSTAGPLKYVCKTIVIKATRLPVPG